MREEAEKDFVEDFEFCFLVDVASRCQLSSNVRNWMSIPGGGMVTCSTYRQGFIEHKIAMIKK